MTMPRWWSQPFPPTGAIASEGIRNQLGRPPVDPLTVFVRETAQNSWDARLPGRPTTYRLEITTVSPTHRPLWERLLTPPARAQAHLKIGGALRAPSLRLLSVVDRGTSGLGGPTRADEVAPASRDWVSFVLNVGEKRDTVHGGGTYGYGKAVLYRLSKIGTILVYTRTEEPGIGLASRLIGIALGDSFESSERVDEEARPFTGRHWWGDVQGDHVEPLRGAEADDVARSLGLTPFEKGESGTTLVVLDPDLDDFDSVDAAARHLAETISWHMWPIMLPERGNHRLVPAMVAGGRIFDVPDPARIYPLRMFVAAYRRQKSEQAVILECKSPRRRLGRFALERTVVIPMSEEEVSQAAAYAGVSGDPHHVCLMRAPELVVRYYEGPVPGSVNKAYAGVFRADDDLDAVYAAAEPPTHDNWVYEQLSGRDKTFVKVTFMRLREQLSPFRATTVAVPPSGSSVPLGAAANFLGGLVAAAFAEPEESFGDDYRLGDGVDVLDSNDGAVPGSGGLAGSSSDEIGFTGGGSAETIQGAGGPGGGAGLGSGGSAGGGPGGGGWGGTGLGGRGRPTPFPRNRIRVSALAEPQVVDRDGDVVVVQRFSVSGPGPVQLSARLSVVAWDGREDEAPAGAAVPTVQSWTTPNGEIHDVQCVVVTPAEVELVVVPVPDTVTDIVVVGTAVTEVLR